MAYKDPNDPRAKETRLRHYYANKEQYAERNRAKKELLRQELRKRKEGPCTDCGVSYPYYVMQFDHVHGVKLYEPSKLINRGSMKLMLDELAKCELVCANCHAARTHDRLMEA